MSLEPFDPYQQWLGIPSQLRPLNHYILLGIRLFESDPDQINQAFDTRMSVLKSFQSGPNIELSEQLIAQVALAQRELVDPEKKLAYDKHLKKRLAEIQENLNSLNENESGEPRVGSQAKVSVARVVDPASIQNKNSERANAIAKTAIGRPVGEEQAREDTDQVDELDDDSFFSYLTDIRVWVAIVTVTVVVMILTVKLLSSPESDSVNANSNPAADSSLKALSDQSSNLSGDGKLGVDDSGYAKVRQTADASFEIPLQKATLRGEEIKSGGKGISGWGQADQAIWSLISEDRRNGYFQCKIIYRAKFECSFSVQLGARPPRSFTVYPHDKDFEEEFIVKLDKSEIQTLRLIAGDWDFSPGVEIKRIRLVPTR